jgi:PAS domain S-box-containing protein
VSLAPGQLYLSAFELDVENKTVAQLPKRVLRFATPVFDKTGRRRGVYVISYPGDSLFSQLQDVRPDLRQRVSLLNAQGVWIKGARPEQESLARTEPGLWARLVTAPRGQARRAGGSLSWRRIETSRGAPDSPRYVVSGDALLIVASEIKSQEFEGLFADLRRVFGILTLLLLASAIFGVRMLRSRRQAYEALLRSEEYLAVTLHSIGDAVLTTDSKKRITRMNYTAERLTGWTQGEASGRPVDEVFRIIHEDTRQPAAMPVDKVLASGQIEALANHTALIARDGTEIPIADSAAPIRDNGGRVIGVVLVFRDVSADRAAEMALRESEARYRTLFESIDEGFCIIEVIFEEQGRPVDYRFVEINPSFERQSGIRDGLGRTMREIAPEIESYWAETFGRVAVTGEPARIQNRAGVLDRTFDVHAFRFGPPELRQVAIIFTDITARKRAEEALRQSEENLSVTLRSIGDAVLTTDTAGRVARMNPIAERLTGWAQAEALGRPIAEVLRIVNEETRQPAVIPVDTVLETGEIQGLANHTVLMARDGTEWPIADRAAPIRDDGGRILGVVLVFREVTAERAAQKALRESEERYRTLFESIGEGFCIIEVIFDDQDNPIDYRFLQINPSFEKQTGLHDAVGK